MRLILFSLILILVTIVHVAALNETVLNNSVENSTLSLLAANSSIMNETIIILEPILLPAVPTISNQCAISPLLEVDKDFYNNTEKVTFRNRVSNKSFAFIIEYWIENDRGDVVKKPVQTSNTNKKQFTPDFDSGEIKLLIKNKLIWVQCNNTNQELGALKEVKIVNPDYVEELEEVVAPSVVKIPVKKTVTKTTVAQNKTVQHVKNATASVSKKTNVTQKKTVANATKIAQTKERTAVVKISSQAGERVINPTSSSIANEDLLYVGPSERSRSYAVYIIIAVLILVIIAFVTKQWQSL